MQVLTFLLGIAHLPGNHHGIIRDTLGVLAGPFILGIYGIGDGYDCLVAHLDLQLRPLIYTAEPQPKQEDNEEHCDSDHISDKPGFVIDILLLDDRVDPFLQDRGLVIRENGEMEPVIPRWDIGVCDASEGALGKKCPLGIKAFQVITDIRILDREVDDLREQLDLTDAPVNVDRGAAFDAEGFPIQIDSGQVHAVRMRSLGIPLDIRQVNAAVTGQKQMPVSIVVIPGIRGQGAVQALPGIQKVIGDVCSIRQEFLAVYDIDA